jgi:hypothetical protein
MHDGTPATGGWKFAMSLRDPESEWGRVYVSKRV